jgi:hypothetical protein
MKAPTTANSKPISTKRVRERSTHKKSRSTHKTTKASKYSVFLSHKDIDKKVTSDLRDLLKRHTKKIDYFISEEIENGIDWRNQISKCLTGSSHLILLFTDPNEDWAFCLYETGFFDALRQVPGRKLDRRIWCLHSAKTEPPLAIANLQSTRATQNAVTQWLKELFKLTNQSKESFINISKLAVEICTLFSGPQLIYAQPSIHMIVDCTSLNTPEDLPNNTIIEGDDVVMRELFGEFSKRTNWAAVNDRFDKFPNSVDINFATLKEISSAVYAAYHKGPVHRVHGIFFIENGPKRYHPVMSQIRQLTMGRIHCEILLIDTVGGQLQNVSKPLAALLTSIRAAVRITADSDHMAA